MFQGIIYLKYMRLIASSVFQGNFNPIDLSNNDVKCGFDMFRFPAVTRELFDTSR